MKAKVIRIYEDFVRELGIGISIRENPDGSFFDFGNVHIEMPIEGDCYPEDCKRIFKQFILDVPMTYNFYLLTLLHEVGHYVTLRDEILTISDLEEGAKIALPMLGTILETEAEMVGFMKKYYSIKTEKIANDFAKAIADSKPELLKKYTKKLNPYLR